MRQFRFGGVRFSQRSQGALPKRSTPRSLCPLSGIVSRPQARVQAGVSRWMSETGPVTSARSTTVPQWRGARSFWFFALSLRPLRWKMFLHCCSTSAEIRVVPHRGGWETRADQWTSRGLRDLSPYFSPKWSVGRWKMENGLCPPEVFQLCEFDRRRTDWS